MGNLCSSFDLIIYSPFIRMYFLISFTLRIVSGFLDEQSQNLKKGTKLVGVLNLYWWVSGWGEGGGGLRKVITKVFNTFCTKKTAFGMFSISGTVAALLDQQICFSYYPLSFLSFTFQ